jgi:hypothetical protein
MRWFNDAAYADYDDAAWDRMLKDYYAHVRRIAPALPPDLARLALEPELNLHDARFERVEIDLDNSTAIIVVNAGDLQAGYRRITMAFTGASIIPDNLQQLGYAVLAEFRPSKWSRYRSVTEIRAQEVDLVANGRFTLRLRLWPFHEFAVEFDGFSLDEAGICTASAGASRFIRHPQSERPIAHSTQVTFPDPLAARCGPT